MVGHTPRPRSSKDDGTPKHLPYSMVAVDIARNPEISDQAFRLYAVMTGFANIINRDGIAGRRRLAEAMNCSVDKISRLLAELERLGVLDREERYQETRNGKRRRTTDKWVLADKNQTSGATRNSRQLEGYEAVVDINQSREDSGREVYAESVDHEGYYG